MIIREARPQDFDAIWPFFRTIVRAGETYGLPRDLDKARGSQLWIEAPIKTFIAEDKGKALGSYTIKENGTGGRAHVCNCGYMTAPEARGLGVATQMCEHSQIVAKELGFKAMQFNAVISTNKSAIRLWQKLGFEIVGTVPKAFNHPSEGFVDAHVMYKWLGD